MGELEQALANKYRILMRIGTGGFGEVYLGEHRQLGRKVAIKILLQSLAAQKDVVIRFQREAKAAATLTHPNIIDIYDVGDSDGIYYFVMKYVEGETLSDKMQREKRMNPGEAISVVRQVADALGYAHDNDVIHRDIKPANVMLDSYNKPVLMDFGVARVQYEANLTKTGTLMGTPHYLPPEQPLGKPVDGRSDIYSLGIMFYEMLAGQPPYHDENSVTLIFKHINEPPRPLKILAPELNPGLCDVAHKMIEKNPDNRFQTAHEVVDALHEFAVMYPAPAIGRRSTPSMTKNTEKLLILAQEHLQQEKFSRAVEIYSTVTKREPSKEASKTQLDNLASSLIEKLAQHVSEKRTTQAWEELLLLEQLLPGDPRVASLRSDLTGASETRPNAEEALTIGPGGPEAQELVRQTGQHLIQEVNQLCDELDFESARELLQKARERFPELVEERMPSLDRHHTLLKKMARAVGLFKTHKWKEAEKAYQEFLEAKPPYDFKVFEGLRKEAEQSLEFIRHRIEELDIENRLKDTDRLIGENRLDEARAIVSQILATRKDQPEAVARLKEIDEKRKQPEIKAAVGIATAPATAAAKPNRKRLMIIGGTGLLGILLAFLLTGRLPTNFGNEAQHAPDSALLRQLNELKQLKQQMRDKAQPVQPAAVIGEVSVNSTPPGASVFVGDENKGVTPLTIPNVAAGKYAVRLRLKGYKDFQQEVEITPQQKSFNVNAPLEQAPPMVGTLVIESNPQGAIITLNNKYANLTPKTIQEVPAGKYNVSLKFDGYEDYTATVRVRDGQTTTVTAQLVEIPKPAPPTPVKPAEPEVKAGMLVQAGTDVTMPKAIKKEPIRYPDTAKAKRLGGTVKLQILVDEHGKVADIKIVQSLGQVFDTAVTSSVRRWNYEPAKKKGVPVKIWVPFSLTFEPPR